MNEEDNVQISEYVGGNPFAMDIKPHFFAKKRHETFLLFKLLEEFAEASAEVVKVMNRDDDRGKIERMMFELADVYNTIALYVTSTDNDDIFIHAVTVKRQRILDRYGVSDHATTETENEVTNDG